MFKEFCKYSISSSFGMLIVGVYIVITGIFISKGIGANGLAAIVIATPFTMIINAFSTIFSMGAANIASNNIGKNNLAKANNVFRQSVYAALLISIVFGGLSLIFMHQITSFLGATPLLYHTVYNYIFYYTIFIIPIVLEGILGTFLRNDKAPHLSMYIMVGAAIITLVLEYILIFEFHMGLKAVAISAGVGQSIATIAQLLFFLLKKGQLSFGKVTFNFKDLRKIVNIGLPTFFISISYSLIIFFSNGFIQKAFGENGMTTYGIINYILSISYYAIMGVANGIQPLISYYFGAKEYKNIYKIYRYGVIMNVLISVIFLIACLFFGKDFIRVFTDNVVIINLTFIALNASNVAYIFLSGNLIDITLFQSIDLPIISNIICFERGVILILIGLYLLTTLMGSYGVWYAMIFSEGVAFILNYLLFKVYKHKKLRIEV
ncbi:MAG: MATE family efflux transporter [Sarcina sp.]